MSDKELCRAWVADHRTRFYCSARGNVFASDPFHPTDGPDTQARGDGFMITWPDGPGLATLTPIPDVWGDARRALGGFDSAPIGSVDWAAFRARCVAALRALLDAHDRGEA